MQTTAHVLDAPDAGRHSSIFTGLLRGYRFRVCTDAASVARALDVRRQVYLDDCGYELPIPDAYDGRSWFLLAEDARTGAAVGSMRVTPRVAGPLEAEEYFRLPAHLRGSRVVEVTRFAILPPYRKSRRFLPVVAMGLFKLICHFVKQLDVQHVVVCSKPERVWTYQWMRFERSGLVARYAKLGGAEHELLFADLEGGIARHRDHRYWQFFFEIDHREVALPDHTPALGLGSAHPVERPALRRFA
jgi:N-acyl-L-homoserine lactone synthetase